MNTKKALKLRIVLCALSLLLFGASMFGSEYYHITFNYFLSHVFSAFEVFFFLTSIFSAVGIDKNINELCDEYKNKHPEEFGHVGDETITQNDQTDE